MTWLTVPPVWEIPNAERCTGRFVAERRRRICVTAWTVSAVFTLLPAQEWSALRREDAVMSLQEEESSAEAHHLQLPTKLYGTKNRSEISDPSEVKTPQTSFKANIDAFNAFYGKHYTYVTDPRDI